VQKKVVFAICMAFHSVFAVAFSMLQSTEY